MKINFIIILLFCNMAFGIEQTRSLDESGLAMEKELLQELTTLPKERHFEIYMNAARNFYTYKVFDKSLEYFNLAIKAESKLSKKEAYLRILQIHYLQGDLKNLKAQLELSKKYLAQNKKENDEDTVQLLNFYEMKLPANDSKVVDTNSSGGFQVEQKDHNFYALFRQEKYQEAFDLLDRSKVESGNIAHQQAEYDLLNVLVHKDKVKSNDLTCLTMAQKYKGSYSYPVMICDILNQYLETNKISPESISSLDDYFTKMSPSKKFLLNAVKKL